LVNLLALPAIGCDMVSINVSFAHGKILVAGSLARAEKRPWAPVYPLVDVITIDLHVVAVLPAKAYLLRSVLIAREGTYIPAKTQGNLPVRIASGCDADFIRSLALNAERVYRFHRVTIRLLKRKSLIDIPELLDRKERVSYRSISSSLIRY
jgi:hypothetical protein